MRRNYNTNSTFRRITNDWYVINFKMISTKLLVIFGRIQAPLDLFSENPSACLPLILIVEFKAGNLRFHF